MKSIKEKAEENCIKYGNIGNVAYQEFEAGANYVLEEIEPLINLLRGGARVFFEEKIKELKGK